MGVVVKFLKGDCDFALQPSANRFRYHSFAAIYRSGSTLCRAVGFDDQHLRRVGDGEFDALRRLS